MKSRISLYSYWRSSCSWRVRWSLEFKGIDYNNIPVNLLAGDQKKPEYIEKNPSGFVPTLALDGWYLGESLAILEWLEETYPKPALLPLGSQDRAVVRQLSLLIACGVQPLQNLAVGRSVSEDEGRRREFASLWIDTGFKKFENLVSKTAGTYSLGEELSLADLFLIPQCYNALRFGIKLDEYPIISRIYHHCLSLESCQKSSPEAQPDANKII